MRPPHNCDCPLCIPGSNGSICGPCWEILTIQRAWSDAYQAVTLAMEKLFTIDGSDGVSDALDRLENFRCDFTDQLLGEPGAMERPR